MAINESTLENGKCSEVKQRQRHVLLHRSGEVCRTLFHNEVNGAVAEHRHPHEGEAGRDEQHARDKFADGSAAGNPSDEHTDERRPESHHPQ